MTVTMNIRGRRLHDRSCDRQSPLPEIMSEIQISFMDLVTRGILVLAAETVIY